MMDFLPKVRVPDDEDEVTEDESFAHTDGRPTTLYLNEQAGKNPR